jgi:hypothetical protein
MALTHKILVIDWNLVSTGALYDDPGGTALHTVNATTSNCAAAPSANLKPSATRSPSNPARETRPDQVAGNFQSRAVS